MTDQLWAVLADVPPRGWDQAALTAALGDLDWVARQAQAHEALIERVMQAGAVVPLKLLTIYAHEQRALEELRRRADAIAAIAEAVRGHHEWTLRVLLDPLEARRAARDRALGAGPPPEPARETPRGARSGRDFLLQKKRERDAVRDAGALAREASAALTSELSALATRAAPRPGLEPQVLAEVTFLVPDRAATRFRTLGQAGCARLAALGCRATLSGPWPAYHTAAALGDGGSAAGRAGGAP